MSNPGYAELDRRYVPLDKEHFLRTRNLRHIPTHENRRGGKTAYGEWCHVAGIFQTLVALYLARPESAHILDVGCGTGLIGIAAEPFVQDGGRYTGIDVSRHDIEFCRTHYLEDHFHFIHLESHNAYYAPEQGPLKPWPIESESQDMVTALSVWTHLSEIDAVYYFRELDRVLKPGSKAIITFFLLDRVYHESLPLRDRRQSKYNNTKTGTWIFDQPCPGSSEWYCLRESDIPERAIGVTPEGVATLLHGTRLDHVMTHPGNWKERPGIFFQDVLVFEKLRSEAPGPSNNSSDDRPAMP